MKWLIILAVFFLLLIKFSSLADVNVLKKTSYKSPEYSVDAYKLWQLVNGWRQNNSLKPYKTSVMTCKIADTRVEDIQTDYSHDKFLKRYSSGQTYPLGENILNNIAEENLALSSWLKSPKHKENIESSVFTTSCIRCKNNSCVQIFGIS